MIPQRLAQRFVSSMIVESVMLMAGINHHRAEPLLHFLGVYSVFSKLVLDVAYVYPFKTLYTSYHVKSRGIRLLQVSGFSTILHPK